MRKVSQKTSRVIGFGCTVPTLAVPTLALIQFLKGIDPKHLPHDQEVARILNNIIVIPEEFPKQILDGTLSTEWHRLDAFVLCCEWW